MSVKHAVLALPEEVRWQGRDDVQLRALEVEDDAGHICTGCIGDGPCEAEPEEPSVSVDDDADSDGDDWPDADPDAAGSHGGLRIYDGEGSKS